VSPSCAAGPIDWNVSGSLGQKPEPETRFPNRSYGWFVTTTSVLAPVGGRAVPLGEVPDPVFAQGMVGHGAAVDPPHEVIDAVAPVGGKILRLMPHAFVIMTPDSVGILVHLGIDTVSLHGAGFSLHLAQGDDVAAGQTVVTYDVPSVVANGANPMVPVVVMDERDAENIRLNFDAGDEIRLGAALFMATTVTP
jgi:PTS system glucose-specific IIA component